MARKEGAGVEKLSRRDLLCSAAVGAAGLAIGVPAAWPEEKGAGPYGPFKMGIQSYSLRGYRSLSQALAQTRELDLHYWEAYPEHIPTTTESGPIREARAALREAGVQLMAYGVVGFGGDAAANRRIFEFARQMKIETISADPAPEAFDQLDQLVEEFGIRIAIHNHGPGARYDSLESVTNAIRGRHRRIGACVDTGHYLRSRVDPVQAIRTLGDRVYGVHLKDVKDAKTFTILGKGDLDLAGTLRALKDLRYDHVLALEYEESPENPMPDLRECLAAVRAAV